MVRRREDVVTPGSWQALSGKLLDGERIADGFVRQVVGKAGQRPLRIHKLAAVSTFYDEHYDTVMLVPAAAAELAADATVRLDPTLHVEHRWVDRPGRSTPRTASWSGRGAVLVPGGLGDGARGGSVCALIPVPVAPARPAHRGLLLGGPRCGSVLAPVELADRAAGDSDSVGGFPLGVPHRVVARLEGGEHRGVLGLAVAAAFLSSL